eukprot:1486170-Alexandrium_andersonii.AAC.1
MSISSVVKPNAQRAHWEMYTIVCSSFQIFGVPCAAGRNSGARPSTSKRAGTSGGTRVYAS